MDTQSGVVSRQQLLEAGLSRSVISRVSSEWRPIVPGIYCSRTVSWNAAVWAGLLRGGPLSVLSGAASGHLDGYIRDAPKTLSIWTPERRSGFVIDRFEVRFRYGWDAVFYRACEASVQVSAGLRPRGWSGEHRACPHCTPKV